MKIRYDLHVHSGLSPCADDDMSPINILAMASVKGLNMIAISDHNAIKNVEVAIKLGELLGITVVPAVELQTSEDIHILCLFETYEDLSNFYNTLTFQKVKNNESIFGEQIVYDEDGNHKGYEENLLLVASDLPSYKALERVKEFNGLAIPAHIDRDEGGMLNVLGEVGSEFDVVELSPSASSEIIKKYDSRKILRNSDAHILEDIGKGGGEMNLRKNTVQYLFSELRGDYGIKN